MQKCCDLQYNCSAIQNMSLYVNEHYKSVRNSVADLGFSPGGPPTPQVGVQTYFFGQKLHENERILTWGARPWRPP